MTCITRWVSRAALTALGCALAAGPALASIPTLFHSPSNTGQDPGATIPPISPNGTRTLNLFVAPGGVATNNGNPLCNAGAGGPGGNGDETCGLNFEVTLDGDLSFAASNAFVADAIGPTSWKVSGNVLKVAIVTTQPPLSAAPSRVGTLTIVSGPVGGNVSLTKLQTVDASLDLMNGAPRSIGFVPEPAALLQLGAGGAALAWLARMRARRGGVR